VTDRGEVESLAGTWLWHVPTGEPCRVVDVQRTWDETVCHVWFPARADMARVACGSLVPLDDVRARASGDEVTYLAAAARVADALGHDELLAPLESSVIPLPHQIHALSRAVSGDRIRYLLADEVGLGKTIEAGLILRELKARGLVRRTLVVSPAGLVAQWTQEMRARFNEEFRVVSPSHFDAWRELSGADASDNLWTIHDQVVCLMDSVKPLERRRGWIPERVARYNRERFDDLVSAGWDLIVVDEAHRLGASSQQVARYRLGEALSHASPFLLLLSATPHQGKTDGFRRVLAFLDEDAFRSEDELSPDVVRPYVIRTAKRDAIDERGQPLFKPRRTQLRRVAWEDGADQRALYQGVSEYVRQGYNQALREKRTAIGFLMILMQRLVTSSTRAIRIALERRLDVLELPEGQLSLFGEDIDDVWHDLDGQEQSDTLLAARLSALRNERAEVELLLSAARRCEARGPDVKAKALLDWLKALEKDEGDSQLKALIFTEFVATQEMLAEFLTARGYSVVRLNGSMDLDERLEAQRAFASTARVLVSTDAGGEGLNLQFCHTVINYDLPWNPMRLEQRIGRVDRIGQGHDVLAINVALDDTVELRVREVLEEKLQQILTDFGVDKLSDVLDSEEAGAALDDVFVRALVDPAQTEREAERVAVEIRQRAVEARRGNNLLGRSDITPAVAQRVSTHRLPFWTERMTVSWLRSQKARGGAAERLERWWSLRWPNDSASIRAVFTRGAAERDDVHFLSLEDQRVRALCERLLPWGDPRVVPAASIAGVSDKVTGVWSLWRIALEAADTSDQRVMPLFVDATGATFAPSARTIWDRLIDGAGVTWVDAEPDIPAPVAELRKVAEQIGRGIFDKLRLAHAQRLARERRKGERAFAARAKAIARTGLPQVRTHRLRELERERREGDERLLRSAMLVPVLEPLIVVRIVAEGTPA
jgi:superfamily II DNA or RNA helicase